MRDQITTQLKKIIGATHIVSPAEYSFAGQVTQCAAAAGAWSQPSGAGQVPLVEYLLQTFYQYCYVQPFNDTLPPLDTAGLSLNESLVTLLSEANNTKERWETGWKIVEVLSTGQIRAEKHGNTRFVWPGEFLATQNFGMPPQIGTQITAFFPKESATLQPGFFFTYGETFIDHWDEVNVMRFYWHIEESGAPKLLRAISSRLNRFRVPYRFKVLNNTLPFNRSDAAVLFLNKKYYRIAIDLMAEVYDEIKDDLKPETPLFSKHIADGLGLAEDPNNGDSFGMNRCRILAEGLWSAHTQNLGGVDEQLAQVDQHFTRRGLDLGRPYLNPGAIDQYVTPGFGS